MSLPTTPVERIREGIARAAAMKSEASDQLLVARLDGMIQGWDLVIQLLGEYEEYN